MVLMQLEDYGFCGIGEGGPFVADGSIRWPTGSIPVNTHGGNLSEAYIIGMTHVKEAVEQIRGTAVNQVDGRARSRSRPAAPRRSRPARSSSRGHDEPSPSTGPRPRSPARAGDTEPLAKLPPEELIFLTPDVFTQPFWEAAAEHRLVVPRCTACATFRLPPSPFCWNCQSQGVEWVEQPRPRAPSTASPSCWHPLLPDLADSVPYVPAVVELPGTGGLPARRRRWSTCARRTSASAWTSSSSGATSARASSVPTFRLV